MNFRPLRDYSAKARKQHSCDYCFHCIEPGSGYTATVFAWGRFIIVLKFHDRCPVDPREEEEELLKRDDGDIQTENSEGFELPMAA
jgi:hypothetical protein